MRSTQSHRRINDAQRYLCLLQRNQLVKRDSALVCQNVNTQLNAKAGEIGAFCGFLGNRKALDSRNCRSALPVAPRTWKLARESESGADVA